MSSAPVEPAPATAPFRHKVRNAFETLRASAPEAWRSFLEWRRSTLRMRILFLVGFVGTGVLIFLLEYWFCGTSLINRMVHLSATHLLSESEHQRRDMEFRVGYYSRVRELQSRLPAAHPLRKVRVWNRPDLAVAVIRAVPASNPASLREKMVRHARWRAEGAVQATTGAWRRELDLYLLNPFADLPYDWKRTRSVCQDGKCQSAPPLPGPSHFHGIAPWRPVNFSASQTWVHGWTILAESFQIPVASSMLPLPSLITTLLAGMSLALLFPTAARNRPLLLAGVPSLLLLVCFLCFLKLPVISVRSGNLFLLVYILTGILLVCRFCLWLAQPLQRWRPHLVPLLPAASLLLLIQDYGQVFSEDRQPPIGLQFFPFWWRTWLEPATALLLTAVFLLLWRLAWRKRQQSLPVSS